MKSLWNISDSSLEFDNESILRKGNVFQLSNGYMGYRGTLDEYRKEQCAGVTLAGIYDQVGDAWREPVNAPNGAYAQATVNGTLLHPDEAQIVSHRQDLDLGKAIFSRNTCFDVGGIQILLKSSRFLSLTDPNLIVVEYSVRCVDGCALEIKTGIDYRVWDLNGPHLENIKTKDLNVLVVSATTHEQGSPLSVAEIIDHNFNEFSVEDIDGLLCRTIRIEASAGSEYTFRKFIAVVKDGDFESPPEQASVSVVARALGNGYEACLDTHAREWQKRWKQSDILIEGDDEAQLALRYSIFQLLMVAPVAGSANSIPARALSGQVYKGAIFWDTEIFMFPFFLYTNPFVARELLQYRINTLDGARRKAASEGTGYRGAFYAWESQETGDEACSYFNVGDPFTKRDLRTYFRDKQIHISGDVALTMWEYFRITRDDSLLLNGGAEVIFECARFYESYLYYKEDKNRYEVLDVVGPDEYHERVNNNAFTNCTVRETLIVALKLQEYLSDNHPQHLESVLESLEIKAQIKNYQRIVDLLYMPQPSPETGVIEQFDGYFSLEDVELDTLLGRKLHPKEYLGTGQGIAASTQIIKQADVVMMMTLFNGLYSDSIKQANWDYYQPRTEHGSSLSACAYSLVATEIGNTDWAYEYFLKTAKIDIEAKYKMYAGTIFMGGSHPAANGGAWMSVVLGFAGLRIEDDRVILRPRMISKWKSLKFNIQFRSNSFAICIDKESVRITASSKNHQSVTFEVAGSRMEANAGGETEVEYSS